jgi:membrane-associated phospholipid phosphatase
MRNIYLILTTVFFCTQAFCNPADTVRIVKPYHVNRPIAIGIIVVGTAADALALQPLRHKNEISDAELSELDPDMLNTIDKWALKQDASKIKTFTNLSDYSEVPIFLLPGLLAINKNIRKDWLDLLLMYVEGHTITFFTYNYSFFGPRFQNRYRPIVYYDEVSPEDRKTPWNRNSFYSGHVASVTYSTFFMTKVFCDYHPDLGAKKILLYAAASVPPALMGYFRVRSLAHFPSDCMVGFTIGTIAGIAVPEFHKFHNKNLSLGMFSSPDGMGLSMRLTLAHTKKTNHTFFE